MVGDVTGENGFGGLVVVDVFRSVESLIELSSSLLLKTAAAASFHVGIVHVGAIVVVSFSAVAVLAAVPTNMGGDVNFG